jgi:CubicO group peptidase (beta-lactamase class C family)
VITTGYAMLNHTSVMIEETIRQAVAAGVGTSIALSVSRSTGPVKEWYFGQHLPDATGLACSAQSYFDLASLTKPLTTTLWFLKAVEAGSINFDDPIGKFLSLDDPVLERTPIWRLLTHSAGLPAHRRYFEGYGATHMTNERRSETKLSVRRNLRRETINASCIHRETYSDLSYLTLSWAIECATGIPLESAWMTLPNHGPESLHFVPVPNAVTRDQYVATERCPWRQQLLQGEVHDDNAWVMGGVCGHAGLFGSLRAVHNLGRQWLKGIRGEHHTLGLSQRIIGDVLDRVRMTSAGTRVMGWDTPTPGASSSGHFFGPKSIGHLGFTGTSIWMDPVENILIVLLSNRVCPSRDDKRIRALRPKLHNLAWTWLAESLKQSGSIQ